MTTTAYHLALAGRPPVVPGSGGRHRRFREPRLVTLVLRRLLAEARGVRR
ncbi:MAG: hypothetical protein ACRDS0_38390 [Pseudonocardiaceae bacterium]